MEFPRWISDQIERCELLIEYTFKDKALCAQALCAANDERNFYILEGKRHRIERNDRLAIYGDVCTTQVMCEAWLASPWEKAMWTTARNRLSNKSLARACAETSLSQCINANMGTAISTGMMATAVQAILGAVFKDGGPEATSEVMSTLGLFPDIFPDKYKPSCKPMGAKLEPLQKPECKKTTSELSKDNVKTMLEDLAKSGWEVPGMPDF